MSHKKETKTGEDIISKLGQQHPKQKRFLKAHLVNIKSGFPYPGSKIYIMRPDANKIEFLDTFIIERVKMDHFENNIIKIQFYL